MLSGQPREEKSAETNPSDTVESALGKAKRAFALKQYEQAIEYYATALELVTKQLGENAPETADLYFSYGKALLENAVTQSSVLGKEQAEEAGQDPAVASGPSSNSNKPILSFSGDAEDEDGAVDLFGKAIGVDEDEGGQGEEDGEGEVEVEEGEEGEPEDDFNAAWEVLDLARAIYDKQVADDGEDEVKLKLADTYIALGDVSLETEKFDQAISDYEAGLKLKLDLLPISSRQIAEAHYKLSIVLDLTSGRLSDAIGHAAEALGSVEARLNELRDGLAGNLPPLPSEFTKDSKGKGKSKKFRLVCDDVIQQMSKSQIEGEIKEMEGLREDLALKVEELKTAPNESLAQSAPAMAAEALDRELNTHSSATKATSAPVINDLTSTVKRKKKAENDATSSKRKAEDEVEPQKTDKKVRLDTPDT